MSRPIGPRRIVCLTEEPTEVLYALGEQERIVGISGFTVRPARARKEKPKVSAFTSAKIEAILALEPDFVVGFSDIQAEIARDLVKAGVEVWISNHRSVEGIVEYIRRLGALVGAAERADAYARRAEAHLTEVGKAAAALPRRPRVYFEEWDEPPITGIRWVAELVRIAGGDDVFPERAEKPLARDRILADANEVVRRAPDLILGSWCGKKFPARQGRRAAGLGCDSRRARRRAARDQVADHPAAGPAALFDGLDAIHRIVAAWPGCARRKGVRRDARMRETRAFLLPRAGSTVAFRRPEGGPEGRMRETRCEAPYFESPHPRLRRDLSRKRER